jgi:alkylation response protein AidB-like acyl-CoA dehydrogenase
VEYVISPPASRALALALRDEDFIQDDPSDMLDDVLAWLEELTDRDDSEESLRRELTVLGPELRAQMGRAIRLGMGIPAARAGRSRSKAKIAAARRNAKLGGRPRKKPA